MSAHRAVNMVRRDAEALRAAAKFLANPAVKFCGNHDQLSAASPFRSVDRGVLRRLRGLLEGVDPALADTPPELRTLCRSCGTLVGLAVADAAGHPFEFMPVSNTVPGADGNRFDVAAGTYTPLSMNRFELKPGQWTDDASMAICMADSLLSRGRFDGSNMRGFFWNWWFHGYGNAFGADEERMLVHGSRRSVGLGGNISKSLFSLQELEPPPPTVDMVGEDAGNGSLMRLGPVPVFFQNDEAAAMRYARESSYTTHPGELAAEACAFLSFAVVRAIHNDPAASGATSSPVDPRAFLDRVVAEYLECHLDPTRADEVSAEEASAAAPGRAKRADAEGAQDTAHRHRPGAAAARAKIARLLRSREPRDSTEASWNWRDAELRIEETLKARGHSYNGYPVSAGYYGAFSVDGLAVALHCVYHTTTFDAAVERCVNFKGDADSTGAMVGQLAGALYGLGAVNERMRRAQNRWDCDGDIMLRGVLLWLHGNGGGGHGGGGDGGGDSGIDSGGGAGAGQAAASVGLQEGEDAREI